MVPSSVTNRKKAFAPGPTRNSGVALKTVPVGADVPVPSGVGMVTTRACGTPAALYKVDKPVPLSDIHQGLTLPRESPQAFTRSEYTQGAAVETACISTVTSVSWYCCATRDPANSSAKRTRAA